MSTTKSLKWIPKVRNYEIERKAIMKERTVTNTHPLMNGTSNKTTVVVSSSLIDPLSNSNGEVELDPLSRVLISENNSDPKSKTNRVNDSFEPWSSRKNQILHQYVTTKKISMTTATSNEESNIDTSKIVDTVITTSERVQNQLKQIDAFEGGQQTQSLTQQEYVNRINEMSREMGQAWRSDQRVKTLKLVIQASKLLGDLNVMEFYPSKFCLITDLLETFGKLVFTRLLEKCASSSGKLPERISPDLVPEATRETTRNWFYKIAIIRELLPRILVETSIINCYTFLSTSEYQSALKRLIQMCRGIGDPLVAAFVRCYICRVSVNIEPNYREPIEIAFTDLIQSLELIKKSEVENSYKTQKLSTSHYLSLFSPSIDWILQCLFNNQSEKKIQQIIARFESEIAGPSGGLILNSFLNAMSPKLVRLRAQEYADLIRDMNDENFPKGTIYRSLGLSLITTSTKENHGDLGFLNSVWKVIAKFQDLNIYMSCAEVWIELIAKEYTGREINVVLGDIIKHLKPDRMFENFYPKLYAIVINILSIVDDLPSLFALDKMLPFLDLFQREQIRNDLFKSILRIFNSKTIYEKTNDPVLISALLHCAKSIHDSLGALTSDDEVREVTTIISSFVRRIDFGKLFEEELKFCVEARGSFASLDSVTITLIHKVNRLVVCCHRHVNAVHSPSSASFVRACLAFCYITIPSLENQLYRLQLYISTAQTAFLCQSLSQADSFLRTAILQLRDFPKLIEIEGKTISSEKYLYESINNIISTLIIAPDNPDVGILNLAQGLQKVLGQIKAFEESSEYRFLLLMNMLCFLSTQIQQQLPYHIPKVESNDALYSNEPVFVEEVNSRIGQICDQLIESLKSLDELDEKQQATLAMEFFSRIIVHADLSQPKCLKFAKNLWDLAQKNPSVETQKFSVRMVNFMETRATTNATISQLLKLIIAGGKNSA